jgi:hypothetical protein
MPSDEQTGRETTYQVSYAVGFKTASEDVREADAIELEEFSTEYEAFGGAREPVEDGAHAAVSVRDSSGNVMWCAPAVELKLGFFGE